MARTQSTMLALGTKAHNFSLLNVLTNKNFTLEAEVEGANATVLMFICNHCPFVKHVNPELSKLAKDYQDQGVKFIAINSNDVESYQDDSPEKMKITAIDEGYIFPYLFDETQEVAKAYKAACTPDFYIFNKCMELEYRGQLDDSRPGNNIPLTGLSIRTALDCIISGTKIPEPQKPSIGCNIKWKN